MSRPSSVLASLVEGEGRELLEIAADARDLRPNFVDRFLPASVQKFAAQDMFEHAVGAIFGDALLDAMVTHKVLLGQICRVRHELTL